MGQQVLLFIVGILVANILSVKDYALVGMLAIFSAIANIVLDSGFSAALIQKKETTAEEFSSVFWFNLGMSILLYGVLMGCSPLIARFFNQPKLVELSAVIFLALPINALTIIQSTILNKQIRFKPLTQINLYSMTVSGIASLAMALTGCGSASSTVSSAAVSSSAAASGSAAATGETFKVGIVNYVDHASLNQIVESVESRLDAIGKEKGVTFDYADYYANAQADQSNLNQIGADLVADGVDVIVAVATPTAATMLAAVEDTDIPVVYSAVTDPAAAGFDGEENITGTSDALNTDAIMNLIVAANPGIDTIGLLYDLSQDASTQAIADAKAFCEKNGIKVVEKNGTTTAEVQMAAEALVAAGVKAVFTPTDNTIMTAELSIYESFIEAGVQHYTGADSFALNGAMVGYGVDYVQLGEATADMVSQLLCDGKTPADLPYQTFDNGIVTINTETAEALGLDLAALKEAFKPYCTEICEVTTAENFS